MKNIRLLKDILTSTEEYWIVAKMDIVNNYFREERHEDQILLIAIPENVRRGLKYDEITLAETEKFNSSRIDQNIFITPSYPPFQRYMTMSEIYDGYPLKGDIRKFLIDALALSSTELYKYKSLIPE